MLQSNLSCHQREAIKRHVKLLKRAKALERFDKIIKSPFDKKLKQTKTIFKDATDKFGDACVVACSWGKDSIVMVHLALQFNPDIRIIFSNTGIELPETLRYRRKMVKEWDLNYIELRREMDFLRCIEEYGYPLMRMLGRDRKKALEKALKSGFITEKSVKFYNNDTIPCCWFLKEKPAHDYYKQHDIKCVFLGITYDESYPRKWNIIKGGIRFKPRRKWTTERIYPIGYWSIEDVWHYINENNIPVNKAYERVDRVGCQFCTGHIGWQKQMAKVNPKLYRKIMKDMLGSNLDDFTDATA